MRLMRWRSAWARGVTRLHGYVLADDRAGVVGAPPTASVRAGGLSARDRSLAPARSDRRGASGGARARGGTGEPSRRPHTRAWSNLPCRTSGRWLGAPRARGGRRCHANARRRVRLPVWRTRLRGRSMTNVASAQGHHSEGDRASRTRLRMSSRPTRRAAKASAAPVRGARVGTPSDDAGPGGSRRARCATGESCSVALAPGCTRTATCARAGQCESGESLRPGSSALSEQPSLRLLADDSVGRETVRLLEALDRPLRQRAVEAVDWTGALAETPQAELKHANGLRTGVRPVSLSGRKSSGGGKLISCRSRLRHRSTHRRRCRLLSNPLETLRRLLRPCRSASVSPRCGFSLAPRRYSRSSRSCSR